MIRRRPPAHRAAAALILLVTSAGCSRQESSLEVRSTEQDAGIADRLQALSVVSSEVVWTSGLGGRFAVTTDGGESWTAGTLAGGEELELRDVEALSAEAAFVLASGPGERSRVFSTDDRGETWTELLRNLEPTGFWDCLAFWDEETGILYGDSVGGELRILRTTDGGTSWSQLEGESLPTPLDGEGGFAASGTCALAGPAGRGWIATGNGAEARVLRTEDRGMSWSAVATPVAGGEAAGLTTLAFWDARRGLAAGGVIGAPEARSDNVTTTEDGGRTWQSTARPSFPGAVYGAAVVPGAATPTVVVVGPGGASLSRDGGRAWTTISEEETWAVAFADPRHGWMVGPAGRITRLEIPDRP